MENLKSLDFWLGVVLVGLLLNVVGNFLWRATDNALRSFSRRWAERSDRGRQKRDARIDRAATDVHVFTAMAARETRATLFGMWDVAGGALLVFLSLYLPAEHWSARVVKFSGTLFFLLGLYNLFRASRIADDLSQAERRHGQRGAKGG